MSLIDNEITKHVLIWFTVNVAYSPSQNIQGQATMSEPPVRSLNFIRDTHQFGWAFIYNDYSTLHILNSISEMKEVSLEKKANLFLSHKYFINPYRHNLHARSNEIYKQNHFMFLILTHRIV